MSISFPQPPKDQVYEHPNGVKYEYADGAWRAVRDINEPLDDYLPVTGGILTGDLTIAHNRDIYFKDNSNDKTSRRLQGIPSKAHDDIQS